MPRDRHRGPGGPAGRPSRRKIDHARTHLQKYIDRHLPQDTASSGADRGGMVIEVEELVQRYLETLRHADRSGDLHMDRTTAYLKLTDLDLLRMQMARANILAAAQIVENVRLSLEPQKLAQLPALRALIIAGEIAAMNAPAAPMLHEARRRAALSLTLLDDPAFLVEPQHWPHFSADDTPRAKPDQVVLPFDNFNVFLRTAVPLAPMEALDPIELEVGRACSALSTLALQGTGVTPEDLRASAVLRGFVFAARGYAPTTLQQMGALRWGGEDARVHALVSVHTPALPQYGGGLALSIGVSDRSALSDVIGALTHHLSVRPPVGPFEAPSPVHGRTPAQRAESLEPGPGRPYIIDPRRPHPLPRMGEGNGQRPGRYNRPNFFRRSPISPDPVTGEQRYVVHLIPFKENINATVPRRTPEPARRVSAEPVPTTFRGIPVVDGDILRATRDSNGRVVLVKETAKMNSAPGRPVTRQPRPEPRPAR